jgi:hypothetical protein
VDDPEPDLGLRVASRAAHTGHHNR